MSAKRNIVAPTDESAVDTKQQVRTVTKRERIKELKKERDKPEVHHPPGFDHDAHLRRLQHVQAKQAAIPRKQHDRWRIAYSETEDCYYVFDAHAKAASVLPSYAPKFRQYTGKTVLEAIAWVKQKASGTGSIAGHVDAEQRMVAKTGRKGRRAATNDGEPRSTRGRKKISESMTPEEIQKEVDELLGDLRASTDPDEKKRIRRALRLRGHQGGLRA